MRNLVLASIFGGLSGCAGHVPHEEYTLAVTALQAAKLAQAPRFAPGLYTKAEDYYRQGQREFDDRNYSSAQEDFDQARKFAEQAENFTVLKKAETGESN